jgi:hypothetical protein
MISFFDPRWGRALFAAVVLSLAPSACSDDSCSGNQCTIGTCKPGQSACTSDNSAVVICGLTEDKFTERSCIDGTVCGPAGGGRFDCVSPNDAGGSTPDGAAPDASTTDDSSDGASEASEAAIEASPDDAASETSDAPSAD